MTPTEILKHEHTIILMVLDAAKREVQSIRQKGKVHTFHKGPWACVYTETYLISEA